jgi:transcriptional regulator with XRE-family HTH domain
VKKPKLEHDIQKVQAIQVLSKLAGVGKTAVFDLEKGKHTIQLDTLLKVLHVLNISISFQSPMMEIYLRDSE